MYLSVIESLPFPLAVLAYVCVTLLVAIFLLVLRINSKLSSLPTSTKATNSKHTSSSDSEETAYNIEVSPGTPFEEFLNEDQNRRSLSKKEQFAAYRDWRSQKGLNWK